jgi:flagellar protein FliT
MLSMVAQIEIYERMRGLSAQMVEAARAGDWERLIALEKSVAALRDALLGGEANAGITASEAQRKAELIGGILEDDAEIRRHTEPWMERLRQFLGGAAKKRQVERAYGARP